MPGKTRASLRAKMLFNVERSNLSNADKECIRNVLDRFENMVEVVRCGECKYYQHYGKTSLLVDNKNMKAGWCQRRIKHDEEYRMLKYDFCSYGERK